MARNGINSYGPNFTLIIFSTNRGAAAKISYSSLSHLLAWLSLSAVTVHLDKVSSGRDIICCFMSALKRSNRENTQTLYCRGFHLDKVRQGPHECLCFYRRVLSFRDTLTQGIHKEKRKWSRWPKAVILCVKICVYAGIWKCRCNKSTDGK